jgi:voltage-gated cation channel
MYLGVDAVGIDMQPKKNHLPLLSIYFISFIIVGNIFVLNLFVGIVIDKFNRLKDRMCGYALMTRDQKEWIESEKQMIRLMLISKKNPPLDPKRLIAFQIAKHKYFEIFINICILFSTIVLSLRFYKMSVEYNRMLENISYVLTFIYNSEAIIKIAAFNMDYFT